MSPTPEPPPQRLDAASTRALRAALVEGISQVPGYAPGPLVGPIMAALTPVIADLLADRTPATERSRDADETAADDAVAEHPASGGPALMGVAYALDDYEASPFAEFEHPGPHLQRFAAAVVFPDGSRRTVVEGSEDRDRLLDVIEHPERYVADAAGLAVTLNVTPQGWNEAFENARAPVLTYFVASMAEGASIKDVVERLPHPVRLGAWPAPRGGWTGWEVRFAPASSLAPLTPAADVIAAMSAWVSGNGMARYEP